MAILKYHTVFYADVWDIIYQGLSLTHHFQDGGHLANHVSAFYKDKFKFFEVWETGYGYYTQWVLKVMEITNMFVILDG